MTPKSIRAKWFARNMYFGNRRRLCLDEGEYLRLRFERRLWQKTIKGV